MLGLMGSVSKGLRVEVSEVPGISGAQRPRTSEPES